MQKKLPSFGRLLDLGVESYPQLSKLTLKNFRCCESTAITLSPLTALVGPNNSGKSTIIDAINLVLGRSWLSATSFSSSDIYRMEDNRDVSIELDFTNDLHHRVDGSHKPIHVRSLRFTYTKYAKGPYKGNRRLQRECLDSGGKAPVLIGSRGQKAKPMTTVPSDLLQEIPVVYIGPSRRLEDHLPGAPRGSMLRLMFKDIADELQRLPPLSKRTEEVYTSRSDEFQKVVARALDVLRTDSFTEIEQDLRTNALRVMGLDPKTEDFRLFFSPPEPQDFFNALHLRVCEQGVEQLVTSKGDGIKNAVLFAILQSFEKVKKKGAIFLIEEPELFLHPHVQRTLYETLRQLSTRNQVIYTTHSPHFVDVAEYPNVRILRRVAGSTVVSASNLPHTTRRRATYQKEFESNRNELFFAQKVILVEGDTERLCIPVYAKRCNVDFDQLGVSVISVGGKRNLQKYIELVGSFQIPFAAVYDEDPPGLKDLAATKRGPAIEEEKAKNAELDHLITSLKGKSICIPGNYETSLERQLGQDIWQKSKENSHDHWSKPLAAYRIALANEYPVPNFIESTIEWASGNETKEFRKKQKV